MQQRNIKKMNISIVLLFVISISGQVQCGIYDTLSSWVNTAADATTNYFCNIQECCNDKQIPYNIKRLFTDLNTNLYGQHIATEVVWNAINSHLMKPSKPLVMIFHGSNGVGKTYVTRMIAKAFYKNGENSRYFHFYYGYENFPFAEKLMEYQSLLKADIESAIQHCERSLFVFDGVEQMPAGLLNVLMPFIDCPDCGSKQRKNKSVFVFLTNAGMMAIQSRLQELLDAGRARESTTLRDFESSIVADTLRHSGGLHESSMITAHAVDFYVPFLPLERRHVGRCVWEAFQELNVTPTDEMTRMAMDELTFEARDLFSKSGCKRVEQIAGRVATRFDVKLDVLAEDSDRRDEL